MVLADENTGPDIPDFHYAVAVPIRQHDGVYEKNRLIPYIVFKWTPNFLRDEEDLLSLVTDVCVIQGKQADIQPPLGYTKINVDLWQTPHELERSPSNDYVFLCYKTDKQINLFERDLLILKKLADLSKTRTLKTSPQYKTLDEYKKFLDFDFNMEIMLDISKTVRDSLLGPCGTYYLQERQDELVDICYELWNKYIL